MCGFSLSQLLLSKNWLFLEKSPIIFKKNFDGMKFFQKLWHKNRIKKLPRAFFECAGYVRVLSKLVCGKMCGFLENRPNSCGFYQKNYGNTGQKNKKSFLTFLHRIFKMGLCKCPKRRVTNQFCFEHRVNVCEHCMVQKHPKVIGYPIFWSLKNRKNIWHNFNMRFYYFLVCCSKLPSMASR